MCIRDSLNTNNAGTVAKKGVRTDKKTYTVTASGGNYYLDGALKPTLNAYRGGSYTFDYTGATSHPFYLSSLPDGKWNSKAYSVQFDGSNDYLNISDNNDWDIGTNPFTIECFVNINSSSTSYSGIFGMHTGSTQFQWRINNVGRLQFLQDFGGTRGNTNDNDTSGTDLRDNTWHHIALTRQSDNSWQLYVDGIVEYSGTGMTGDVTGINEVSLGRRVDNNANYLTGYISNLRFVSGTALYSSNFTPPTTTLTNVSGTILLCCQDGNAATGAVLPTGASITTSGAAATKTKQPFLYDNNHGNFGLNLSTSNTTKITIPHTAADTLYYYCNAHSGMGSSINVTTDIFKADPYAWKNVLAVPFVGSTDDASAELSCTSTTKTDSLTNSPTSSSLGNFYKGSREFVGSNGQRINYSSSAQFDFGASDFTVEGWYYHQSKGVSNSERRYFVHTETSWDGNKWIIYTAFTGNVNKATFYTYPTYNTNGSAPHLIGTTTFAVGNWYHIAVTRSGNTFRLFVNGILEDSADSSTSVGDSSNVIQVGGGSGQTDRTLYGNVQDVRIYKGVAKYTENFVVGSTEPDILPDSPSGITGKTNLTKITDGAVFIDRSSDEYLQAPASTDFRLDGQYCIEYFLNLTDYSNDSVYVRTFVLDGPTGDGGTTNIHLNVNPSTGVLLFWSGGGELISGTISIAGDWHHVCLTRDSSNKTRLFIDGILSGSADITTDYNLNSNQNRPRLGALGNTGGTTGHYSNWRITKGSIPTEYQTSTTTNGTKVFDSPTEALTTTSQGATANDVKLIACQSNTEPGGAAVAPSISGPNTGTQWSSKVTPGSEFRSGYGAGNAFDGNSVSNINGTTACEINKVSFVEFDFGSGIPFTTLQMQCDDNNEGTVKVNGVDITSQLPTGSFTNTTITGVTSPLKKIRLDAVNANASSVYLGSVTIDGVMLKDPLTRNGEVLATTFNPITDDINTIRGQETGYATLNPLNATGTVSDGNLSFYRVGKGGTTSTIGVESGKIYVEAKGDGLSNGGFGFGFVQSNYNNSGQTDIGDATNSFGIRAVNNNVTFKIQGATNTGISINSTSDTIFAYAVDFDTGLVKLLRDGVVIHSQTLSLASGTYYAAVASETGSATKNIHVNFGQKPFKFPPPDGFQPLSLSNVQPEKVIARPDQYVAATLFTGTGDNVSSRTVELPHAADLVWAKSRDRASAHQLLDTVRGNNLVLQSNSQINDRNPTTQYTGGGLSTIDGKTITIASGTSNNQNLNVNGNRGVIWSWKAGGSKNTFNIDDVGYATASAAGLTAGTITPTGASVGTKQGFSIIKYTGNTTGGATVSHGLSQDPKFIVIKNIDQNSTDWLILHTGIGPNGETSFGNAEYNMFRFDNAVPANNSADLIFPGSNGVFALGTEGSTWANGAYSYIAYCWHDVSGLQKFGTYTGNGSGDGTFVELGFRPALLWIKATGAQGNWVVVDTQRDQYNPVQSKLYPDYAGQENVSNPSGDGASLNNLDILSNGFKLRSNNSWTNSAQTYIYCAWAEAPNMNLYGAQANAR